MASRIFKPSRLIALAVVVLAILWFAAGQFGGGGAEEHDATTIGQPVVEPTIPIQKVGVTTATPESHSRQIVLSCVTSADRRASAVARGAGVLIDLRVSRGDRIRAGDVIAQISDEGRSAALGQAQANLDQVLLEYDARKALVESGDSPRNTLAALEAGVAAARAALAAAQAEADRSQVKAPIDGVIDTVPLQVGQAVAIGSEIAEIIDPNPMLAVGQVSEARRNNLSVGQTADVRFIDGSRVTGTVDFVGLSANTATRTYPVEASMANADGRIADGVTCEMVVTLEPVEAAAVPRSALIFSDQGHLGVRVADNESRAQFLPVEIVDDGRELVWVTGIDQPTRVIVVGQDFVREGDLVEAVAAAATASAAEPPP